MALFKKFFYRKPPDGLLEIAERVYVFDCCFSTEILEENEYKVYMGGIVKQLQDQFPDAYFMVFNFREGVRRSQITDILSEYDMTVMDYPKQYEGCPLLPLEMIHHFLRSSESWLSLEGQHNVLLVNCERGGWPVLAFMLAGLLIYRKQYSGEQKTLDMIYRQAPKELLQLLSPLNPLPSQLRYLQYVSRRNVGSEWPPLVRALTLDCVILRTMPNFNGAGGCRPIFRIYGQDPFSVDDQTPKLLFSMPKKSKNVRLYRQADCELVKIDIHCHIQGDIVLECINLDEDLEREEMMFRVMFNTAFIRSNILMLNRDEIDILWNAKDKFPKDFRTEVLLSDMDAAASLITAETLVVEEKDGLPIEAFAKVQEIFNNVDWLDAKGDAALQVLQQITSSNVLQQKLETAASLQNVETKALPQMQNSDVLQEKLQFDASQEKPKKLTPPAPQKQSPDSTKQKLQEQEVQGALLRPTQPKIIAQRTPPSSLSNPASYCNSLQCSPIPPSRFHSAPSALGITAVLHDHSVNGGADNIPSSTVSGKWGDTPLSSVQCLPATYVVPDELSKLKLSPATQHSGKPFASSDLVPSFKSEVSHSSISSPLSSSISVTGSSGPSCAGLLSSPSPPPPPPPPPLPQLSPSKLETSRLVPLPPVPPPPPPPPPQGVSSSGRTQSIASPIAGSVTPPLPPPAFPSGVTKTPPPPPPPFPSGFTKTSPSPPPPPPSKVASSSVPSLTPPPLPTKRSAVAPSPPPPPPAPLRGGIFESGSPTVSPPPPPPPRFASGLSKNPGVLASQSPPPPPVPSSSPAGASSQSNAKGIGHSLHVEGRGLPFSSPLGARGQGLTRSASPRTQSNSKRASLKPLHWVKVTRAMQGSLWAEPQKLDEASKAPEFDMSELESLFSAVVTTSDSSREKSSRRSSLGTKSDKINLIDLRRANNCEIMLTKVKMPLPDLMSSVLALDDSVLDVDQVDNLIKFCPTKEEMELLKGYNGDKENLGKCEQFFLELMKVPRVESKLRVFSFKIQFGSQVSDLSNSLNIVNSAAEEIRNSAKLKRIMQTILSLGNALNQGTARGSAIGFRLDSLLKLTDTRARNNKMTLMHYLCKVLADKLPELLDFHKDLVSLESATKIQLKYLAEEMQAINKGLEKVEQELTASENDGPVSQCFCKTLKSFLEVAESDVRSLTALYSGVGRNADALALYFGEDPARCPFEQVVSTLLNFVKTFMRAHEENCKQTELDKKKAQKEAEAEKMKVSTRGEPELPRSLSRRGNVK